MFSIDLSRYRLIDLSYEVNPPGTEERPFVVERGLLADLAYKYDISKTHTHVGTHVESPAHFFDDGKSIDEMPLDHFFGRAVLLPIKLAQGETVITPEYIEATIGDIYQDGDIVVARNDMTAKDSPYFGPGAGEWLARRSPRLLVLGNEIGMGSDIDTIRHFHDVLQSKDLCFVEFLSNLEAISQREFFFMALPFKVKGLDSGWARAIALEEF